MGKLKNKFRKRWLIFSISGLIFCGAGLSLITDAAIYKNSGADTWFWILYGTLALVVFNSGLCFIGQGIIYRVKMLKKKDL